MALEIDADSENLQYTNLSSDLDIDSSTVSSVAVWLRGTSAIGSNPFSTPVFFHGTSSWSDGWGIHSQLSSGTIRHVLFTNGGNSGHQDTGIGVDTDYHLAAIFDQANGDIFIYINGSLLYSNTSYSDTSNGGPHMHISSDEGGTKSWRGRMSEFGYWPNTKLTTDQIAAMANGNSPILAAPHGLKVYNPLIRRSINILGPSPTENGSIAWVEHPRQIYEVGLLVPVASPTGTSAQTITLPLLASGEAFFTPTVTPQAADLTLPLITSGEAFYQPTIAPQAVDVTLPLIASGETLFQPTITVGAATVTLPLLASGETLYTFELEQNITLPLIASGETLYAPEVELDVTLPIIASGEVLYQPTIDVGAVTVTLPLIASAETLYAPDVSQGIVVTLPLLASGETLHQPTLVPGAVDVTLPLIGSGETLYALTVQVGAQTLELPLIASSETLFQPTITVGSVDITLPAISSGEVLHALQVDYVITLPIIGTSETFYSPDLVINITFPVLASGEALYSPEVVLMLQEIVLPLISSGIALYDPTVTGGAAVVAVSPAERTIDVIAESRTIDVLAESRIIEVE